MYQPLGSHSALVAAVRDLRTKKGRREAQQYAIEGPTLIAEAVESGLAVGALFGTQAALEGAAAILGRLDCPVYTVPEAVLSKMSDLTSPPGLIATLDIPRTPLAEALAGEAVLLLAGVSDPGNAGSLLRTAEIFGVQRALFTDDAVEPFNPKVVRSAMGAIFRMSVAVATADAIVKAARAAGYRIVAAALGGTPLPEYVFAQPCLIAIGNERRGVAASLPAFDDVVSIPQAGAGESLNAAVAGAIVLYAFSLSKNSSLSSLGGHFAT